MASTRIYRTLAGTGSNGKLTISFWVKRAKLGSDQEVVSNYYSGSYYATVRFLSDDTLEFRDYRTTEIMRRVTNRVFRDTSAWYHIVCNFDNSLGTTSQKVFVNGVEETSFSSSVDYSTDADSSWNTDYLHEIGCRNSSTYFDGSLSDLYFIQGQQYDASTFGETDATTGEWKPKTSPTIDYSCTGTNSYHLKFENSANMDLDSGDNTVSFTTAGNLTQTEDCPADVFATFNSAFQTSYFNLSNGNTTGSAGTSAWWWRPFTLAASAGKYYCEVKLGTVGTSIVGIADLDDCKGYGVDDTHFGKTPITPNGRGFAWYSDDGKIYYNDTSSAVFGSYTTGDTLSLAMDLDNRKFYIAGNGSWLNSGDPTSGATGTGAVATIPAGGNWSFASALSNSCVQNWNMGNGYFGTTAISSAGTNASEIGLFELDVPTGFTAISTKGLNS